MGLSKDLCIWGKPAPPVVGAGRPKKGFLRGPHDLLMWQEQGQHPVPGPPLALWAPSTKSPGAGAAERQRSKTPWPGLFEDGRRHQYPAVAAA